jgi:IS5 family transposase
LSSRITDTKQLPVINNLENIIDIIEKKRLQWYGHVKRMQEKRLPKLIMEWIPGERRKRGLPRKRGRKAYEQPWKQDI